MHTEIIHMPVYMINTSILTTQLFALVPAAMLVFLPRLLAGSRQLSESRVRQAPVSLSCFLHANTFYTGDILLILSYFRLVASHPRPPRLIQSPGGNSRLSNPPASTRILYSVI